MLFWHGRCFAWKASNFMMWFLFKGMLFSIPMLFFNTKCAFSGQTFIEDYYFALYEVILTTFAIYFYLLLDQDEPFKDASKPTATLPRSEERRVGEGVCGWVDVPGWLGALILKELTRDGDEYYRE